MLMLLLLLLLQMLLLLLMLQRRQTHVGSDEDVESVFSHDEVRAHLLLKSISSSPSLADAPAAVDGDATLHLLDAC